MNQSILLGLLVLALLSLKATAHEHKKEVEKEVMVKTWHMAGDTKFAPHEMPKAEGTEIKYMDGDNELHVKLAPGTELTEEVIRRAFGDLPEAELNRLVAVLTKVSYPTDKDMLTDSQGIIEKEVEFMFIDEHGNEQEIEVNKQHNMIVVEIDKEGEKVSVESSRYETSEVELDLADAIIELIQAGKLDDAQKARIAKALAQ